jgi:hypothetical protein
MLFDPAVKTIAARYPAATAGRRILGKQEVETAMLLIMPLARQRATHCLGGWRPRITFNLTLDPLRLYPG